MESLQIDLVGIYSIYQDSFCERPKIGLIWCTFTRISFFMFTFKFFEVIGSDPNLPPDVRMSH